MKKQSLLLIAGMALLTSACANLCETPCSGKPCSRGEVVFVSSPSMFAFNSADLTAQDKKALSDVAARLNSSGNADKKLVANGYASMEGPASYNVDLSQRRAAAVKSYLVGAGVAADRISTKGYGATDAFGPKYRDNRRVEVVVD